MQASNIGNTIGEVVVTTAGCGAVGYLGTMAFTNLNPMVGFVFGVAYRGVSYLVNPIFNRPDSTASSQLVGEILKTGLAAGIALSSFGLAVSFKSTLALGVSTLVMPAVVIVGGVLALTVTGLAVNAFIQRRHLERIQYHSF